MQHFDLVVVGSGSGNSLIDARFSDWNVALIDEYPHFGGTCLTRGCIPTKMFVVPAEIAAHGAHADRLGIHMDPATINWPAIRDRVFGRIDPISEGGLEWRQQSQNVTVFRERASFIDEHTLLVGDERIHADRVVLAAGSRPRPLEVPGVEDEKIAPLLHTSDSIMRIDALPKSLVILGGGVIAAEFANVFSSFGVEVTVVHRSETLMRKEDVDINAAFSARLADTVNVRLNQKVVALEEGDVEGTVTVVANDRNGVEYLYQAEAVLIAFGRVPNADLVNPRAAGLELTRDGRILVDDTQRTSKPHIWAFGDVSNDMQLKHLANAEMRVVQHNIMNPDSPITLDRRYVPHAVFSNPQIASVGATEQQLVEWGRPFAKHIQPYSTVAYGWALEDEHNFVKLLADPGSGHLLGAHIMGDHAALLIQPLIQAMSFGLPIEDMARGQFWIHPALTEVIENALLGVASSAQSHE